MTGRLIPPGDPEFVSLFDSFDDEAFNFETLQRYGAAGEDADFAAFLAGDPAPPQTHDAWLDMVRRNTATGRAMRRVHAVLEPLSDYVRYEMAWPYALCSGAGEDIRIMSGHVRGGDFWLFDRSRLYRQHHSPEGRWLGTEPVEDPNLVAIATAVRDAAWTSSTPWLDYIATRPDIAARIPAQVA